MQPNLSRIASLCMTLAALCLAQAVDAANVYK